MRAARNSTQFCPTQFSDAPLPSCAGKLTLVDLAGMESAKKSYAAEGPSNQPARREEAKNINTSLYALGTVIERLASGDVGHVPWRNSKLTRLLQDSFGGNSRSAIVTTLRAEEKNIDETIGTLRFAQRAKAIAVKVTQNEVTRDAGVPKGAQSRDPTSLTSHIPIYYR